jgi:hypothetical protein
LSTSTERDTTRERETGQGERVRVSAEESGESAHHQRLSEKGEGLAFS